MQETEARRLAEELLGGYRGRESLGRGDTRLDIREIEREACEGQEQGEASLGPPPGTAITSPLPLDQLLAQALGACDSQDPRIEQLRTLSMYRAFGFLHCAVGIYDYDAADDNEAEDPFGAAHRH